MPKCKIIWYLNDSYSGWGLKIFWKYASALLLWSCWSFDPLVIIPPISSFSDESVYETPCYIPRLSFNRTSTVMVGHVPLIKFKCIPTGIRLRSCYPRTEYNRRNQCMKQRDLQLVLTILYARLWIKKLCRLGLFVFVIWLKAPNVWSLRKLVYIIYLANEESPPSNCYKITWITNFFPIHYPNQPLFVNNKRRKKKKRTGALLLGLILLFAM